MNSPIKFPEKLGYFFNGTVMSMLGYVTGIYLMFYFTDIFGLAAGVAGTILLAGRIWDGLNDVITGYIVDNVHSKHGKLRPYLLWFAIPTAIVFALVFANPNLDPTQKIIYALVTYLIYDTLFTFASVSSSLIMRATDENKGRVTLTFFGAAGNSVTNLVLPLLFYPVAVAMGGGDFGRGFSPMVMVLAVLVASFLLYQFFTSKERVVPVDQEAAKERVSLREGLSILFSNRPWIICQLASFASGLALFFVTAILPYYMKYIIENEGAIASLLMPFAAAQILVYFFIPRIATRFGKRNTLMAAMALAIFSRAIVIIDPNDLLLLTISAALLGVAIAFTNLFITMIADTVDFGEWKRGKRIEGMTSAVGGFFLKLSMAGAAGGIGWVLQANGYDAALAVQPESAINSFYFIIIYIPIIVFAIAIGLLSFYDLDRLLPQMRAEMEQRRVQMAAPLEPAGTPEPGLGIQPAS
jgi:glycoside/pentoside/hexuronide:cation symporter, GPH family